MFARLVILAGLVLAGLAGLPTAPCGTAGDPKPTGPKVPEKLGYYPDQIYWSKTCFKLTPGGLKQLRAAKVPEDCCDALEPLLNKEFKDAKDFVDALAKSPLGKELAQHQDLLLKHAKFEQRLKIDVIAPKGAKEPLPAVLIIHGGGWIWGNYKDYTPRAVKLAERGYVAVLVNHRFTTTDPFPAQIYDVKNAVRWVRANAAKFGIDPERLGVYGYSSGGHLACMLGLCCPADGLEGAEGQENSSVQCVVSCSGLTDLCQLYATADPTVKFALEKFLQGPPAKMKADYDKASPITYCQKPAPPVLFIHGTADKLIPFEQSERLYAKLKAAGAETTLLAIRDAGHDFAGDHALVAEAAAIAYFDRHLRSKGK